MTFSIVAYDPAEAAWGVAVASKFMAVGAIVPHAHAGAGAVATQSFAKYSYGPDGLARMGAGESAQSALDALVAADDGRDLRQVGMVDARGGAASYTGASCFGWAGQRTGEGFACQGNMLTAADVIDALADTFIVAKGELADRLAAALLAADEAGGDKRGKQGAAILVVKAEGGYGGDHERYLDLRVDDHPEATREVVRLTQMHHVFFQQPKPEDLLPVTEEIARELQAMMTRTELWRREADGVWDDEARAAFWALVGAENLEERWSAETTPNSIDRVALEYLRGRFGE
jgi:uncharacterized Ntn-hydrolase superfamily protein